MLDEIIRRNMMKAAIDEAKESSAEDEGIHPFVGVVIANDKGDIIAKAHRGESGTGRHAEFTALAKSQERGIDLSEAEMFLTLEPCTARGPGKTPCSDRIINSGIRRIHIGMLDPNPQILGRGETELRWNNIEVERFPSELIRELEELNRDFISIHKNSHLPDDSLYVKTQISDLILQHLQREGLDIKELPYDWDLTLEDLIHYCHSSYPDNVPWDLGALIRRIRGTAFDKKYADYTYEGDARGFDQSWRIVLQDILNNMGIRKLSDFRVINVGIGNGMEGEGLLDDLDNLTAVDIAPLSLELAKKKLPRIKTLIAEAEDLNPIRTCSQDVYISLRTYQSSYFDSTRAIREAYRVLRPGAAFISSVANAFIGEDSAVIPGLIIPRTTIIDRDRPFDVAERIRKQLNLLRFDELGIQSCKTEIFVYGKRSV